MCEAVECHEYLELPALTIGVDGDGAGRTVILELEEMGIPVERIHWGLPCHSDAEKNRYFNLRAYDHCKMREAIFTGRFKGPSLKNSSSRPVGSPIASMSAVGTR